MNRSHYRPRSRSTRVVLPLVLFAATWVAVPAQATDDESVPADTCILELNLPDGATVKIDGHDYGTKRRLQWSALKQGTVYRSRLTVAFPGKGSDERIVLIEGGQHIRLVLSAPNPKVPKIVPQMGHTNVLTARMSSDGRWLLTGGADGLAILWDVKTGRSVHVFRGLGNNVCHVALGGDGMRILAASSEAVGVWDLASPDQPIFFRRGYIRCAEISPDGRTIASNLAGPDEKHSHVVTIWDVESGKRIHTLRGHDCDAEAVVFSHDGRRLLTGAHRFVEQTIDQQRQLSKQLSETLKKKTATVSEILQSAQKMTATVGQAILWDLATGKMIRKLKGHNGNVTAVAISPDGRKLATASEDNTLILWDATSGQRLLTLKGRGSLHVDGIASVLFSSDGRQLLSASRAETILWDVVKGKQLHSMLRGPENLLSGGAFTPEGPLTITATGLVSIIPGDSFFRIRILNLISQDPVYSSICQEMHSVGTLALSPDGRHMATANSANTTAVLWDGGTGRCKILGRNPMAVYLAMPAEVISPGSSGALKGHSDSINCLAFSPDGRHVITGSSDTSAILWDVKTGGQIHKLQGHRGPTAFFRKSVPFSLSLALRYLANGGNWENAVGSTRMDDFEKMGSAEIQPGRIECVAFSTNGKYVITGAEDEKAIVWECATGRKIRELSMPHKAASSSDDIGPSPRNVCRVALSPNGKLALTGSCGSPIVILWDVATGKKLQTLEENLVHLYALTFSTDGQPLVLAQFRNQSADRRISLRNVQTGEVIRHSQLLAVEHSLDKSVLSPDQKRVAFFESLRGTVVVLDLDLDVELRRITGHDAAVESVAFSPDGQRLLTGSQDGTCRLWDIATGQELARIATLKDQGDWLIMTPEGLFDGSAGGREKVMFRVGGGLNVVPVDRFFQDFYYPGLLAAIWRGERPLPKVEMGQSLPPKVRIVSPEKSGVVEADCVTVEVEVIDEGGGIRGPWLVQNDARVLAPEKTQRQGKRITRTFEIALVGGENKLEFHAASADGSWESEPAVMTLRYEKPLPKPELYLVSVGVNRYADESMNLGLAAGDARAMAELFQQRGPALYKEVHTTTLLDEQATASAILDSLRQLAEKARPQDTVAVFLSGHGAVVGRQYYFLPHEFSRQAEALEDDVQVQGLSAAKLQEALVAIPALKRVVVFDTGQSGGKAGLARTARDPFAFRGAIERLSRSSGAFMIAAAAVSDDAREVPDLKHGVLTYTLLAGLHAAEAGPLADQWIQPKSGGRVADVLDWFGFASSHVPRLTKRYFGRQQEVQHSSLGTSFPVLPVPSSGEPARIALADDSAPTARPKATTPKVLGTGKAKLHVVAVGIDQYREEAMNLKFARADAKAMAGLFRNRGKRQYQEVSTAEVLDGQATKQGILDALEKVAGQTQPEDTLVVFLSGHGRMVGQRYYLIPHEFHRQANDMEEDVRRQGLPADVLADIVSKVPARKRILIFDTCASGGALKISRQGQGPFGFRGAIEKLGERQGVFTIAASAVGQEAQEIEALGHGVLTYALLAGLHAVPPGGPLEGLSVQPNGPEGMVDVLEWFSFASGHVPRLTKRYLKREQHVQTSAQGASFTILSAWE